MCVRKTKEQFIKEAEKIHNNIYGYSAVDYKNSVTKVKIICPIHGEFIQAPFVHLQGCGCKKCGARKAGDKMAKGADEFIKESAIVHGNFYNYNNVEYTNAFAKVIINCPIHGSFTQAPHDHVRGRGCQICGDEIKHKKWHNKPTTLYQFKFKDIWKVGITTRLLQIRYSKDYPYLEDIEEYKFNCGLSAYKIEQEILAKNSNINYCGDSPFSDGTGTTECFTEKINIKDFI